MSDTAEDLQEGLRVRAGRGAGELPIIDTREAEDDDIEEGSDESMSTLCGRLCDMLLTDQLACDVQVTLLPSTVKYNEALSADSLLWEDPEQYTQSLGLKKTQIYSFIN